MHNPQPSSAVDTATLGLRRRQLRRQLRDRATHAQYHTAASASGYADAYEGWGSVARFNRSRRHAVDEAIRRSQGDLVDIGSGPGMFVRHLLDTRPSDFRITACDRSPAMIDAAAGRLTASDPEVCLSVSRIEDLPFDDCSFDVALALGVLEYVDIAQALPEVSRIVRPGGLVIATMLNPASPYRLFEWCIYWPARRLAGRIEGLLGIQSSRPHGARRSGIRAVRRGRLARLMRGAGLTPYDVVAFDITSTVPPFDKLVRRHRQRWRDHPERTVSRGLRGRMGTGYLIAARKAPV